MLGGFVRVLLIVLVSVLALWVADCTVSARNDREFLTNYQLKRLIEENVLRKADIAKLPVSLILLCIIFDCNDKALILSKLLHNIKLSLWRCFFIQFYCLYQMYNKVFVQFNSAQKYLLND